MESLYTNTNKLIQEVQGDLGKLAKNTDKDGIHLFENEIQAKIDIIVSNCERLTILVNKEQPTRRASAKLRVDQLKYDCQHIQAGLKQLQQKRCQNCCLILFHSKISHERQLGLIVKCQRDNSVGYIFMIGIGI